MTNCRLATPDTCVYNSYYVFLISSVLLIGFEQGLYQFHEDNEIRTAVITKVGGRITEQTYSIDLYVNDESAINGLDYGSGHRGVQRYTVLPDQQSFQFPFEILEDNILEQEECFTISLENVPEIEPRFETQGTITTTTICILDRTRKIKSNIIHDCVEKFSFL